jgi:hypothetical protein
VSRRAGTAALVAAIVVVAAWLRVVHLGTPSLWWDEIVQIRTAERPVSGILGTVRIGVGPGSGTAGAMPLDYLVLHAWLESTAPPAPERLEAHFRTPACAASVAAVLALFLLGRALFGAAAGTLAAWLLAISLPAILYAAEVRSYSLLSLMTIASTAAFAGLVRAPGRASRWVAHFVANVLYVFTGIFGLFVVGVQYAVLALASLRRRPGRALAVVGSGAVLGLVLWRWFEGGGAGIDYPRNAVVEPLAVTWASLVFFAGDARSVVVAFVVALPFVPLAGRRCGVAPVAWAIVLSFASLPAIALVIRWKHYYFHERHVLFLLPLFHLALAAGLCELARRLDPLRTLVRGAAARRAVEAAVLGALALAIALPGLRGYVATPDVAFQRTKTLRDVAPVARDLAARAATLPDGEPLVVLAERNGTANAVLASYLRWYGLDGRVALRSPGVPLDQIEPALRASNGDPAPLALRSPHGLYFALSDLLGIQQPIGVVPAHIDAYAIVGWTTAQSGADVRRYQNVSVRVPGARSPSPPRS